MLWYVTLFEGNACLTFWRTYGTVLTGSERIKLNVVPPLYPFFSFWSMFSQFFEAL